MSKKKTHNRELRQTAATGVRTRTAVHSSLASRPPLQRCRSEASSAPLRPMCALTRAACVVVSLPSCAPASVASRLSRCGYEGPSALLRMFRLAGSAPACGPPSPPARLAGERHDRGRHTLSRRTAKHFALLRAQRTPHSALQVPHPAAPPNPAPAPVANFSRSPWAWKRFSAPAKNGRTMFTCACGGEWSVGGVMGCPWCVRGGVRVVSSGGCPWESGGAPPWPRCS